MFREIQDRYSRWKVRRDDRWIVNWAESRKAGPIRFISIVGVLGWGVPMAGIALIAGLYAFPKLDWPFALEVWLRVAPLLLVIGAAHGCIMWLVFERAYKRLADRGRPFAH